MTKRICSNIVRSLPEELLSKILMHTASNSVTDFVNVQLSCKAFHEASNHNYIYRDVSMKNVGLRSWSRNERKFQKRCEAANNPEALYILGMFDYLSGMDSESGLRCLKKVAEKGHTEAVYAYGIILICFGGDLREQGLRIAKTLDLSSFNRINLRDVRVKIKEILHIMWKTKNIKLAAPERIDCRCDKNCPRTSGEQRWEPSHNFCTCYDSCFWYHEATLFCGFL
ncbi:hypothetical protein HRI_002878600 [Hibiscus trionum]|uniref:F-box domain-containing protein n=1 Tax=Hibiscus trionum TaxID=183268 RepID=A0A9W7ICX3_HIBTR|nr:hypothetical protein HRI_002878600 [Hibiscus trionum]